MSDVVRVAREMSFVVVCEETFSEKHVVRSCSSIIIMLIFWDTANVCRLRFFGVYANFLLSTSC